MLFMFILLMFPIILIMHSHIYGLYLLDSKGVEVKVGVT